MHIFRKSILYSRQTDILIAYFGYRLDIIFPGTLYFGHMGIFQEGACPYRTDITYLDFLRKDKVQYR